MIGFTKALDHLLTSQSQRLLPPDECREEKVWQFLRVVEPHYQYVGHNLQGPNFTINQLIYLLPQAFQFIWQNTPIRQIIEHNLR